MNRCVHFCSHLSVTANTLLTALATQKNYNSNVFFFATFFQHVWFYSNGSGTGVGVILREWDRTGLIFLLRPGIGTGQDFFSGSGTGQE